MKKSLLFGFLCLFAVVASAQIKDGFYRVHNLATDRYIYVLDNTGSINIATASADMGALKLWKDKSKTLSDPATIVYAEYQYKGSYGEMYDLRAQGTGVHDIIGYYVNIFPYTTNGAINQYYVYAEGKYLTDPERSSRAFAYLGTTGTGDYRIWIADPVDMEDNYFAVSPSIAVGGKYYAPFYASFAFSFPKSGLKAKYISKIDNGYAVMSEVKTEIIPASMPVFIECNSNNLVDNKLQLLASKESFSGSNLLRGVYFNYDERQRSKDAQTAYDPKTMRVLGITSEGKLGFVTSSTISFLPANQCYLPVSEGTPAELTIIDESDYLAGINQVKTMSPIAPVFDLNGKKVSETSSSLNLPQGVYIFCGKKIYVK